MDDERNRVFVVEFSPDLAELYQLHLQFFSLKEMQSHFEEAADHGDTFDKRFFKVFSL